jgi:glycosyltransferase involved in cell wall biosynthesis
MKILMIAPQPILEPRGTSISVYQRLKALSALGHQVDLVAYHLGEDIHIPGVEVHRIPNIPFIKLIKIGPSLPKLFLDFIVFIKAFYLLFVRRYELIHSHEEAAFFSVILAEFFGTLHVYDMHSSLPTQLQNFGFWSSQIFVRLFKSLEKLVLYQCDAVITIDDELFGRVKNTNPCVPCIKIDNLAVWNGFHEDEEMQLLKIREHLQISGKIPIVYTGSFAQYQGLELLLESADIVRQTNSDISFILVGGHSDQVEKLQKLTRTKQLENYVRFPGSVPPDQVTLYLMLAEVLVSPRLDGTSVPLKIYSYLQSGKPIIATKLPTHTQVLNDQTALLVEPTKEAFAEGILKLLKEPHLGKNLGHNGRKFLEERYGWDIYLGKVEKIYHKISPKRACKVKPSEI